MIQLSIPYRNMPVSLEIFLYHLRKSKNIDQFKITVIEQYDQVQKFNLGILMNIGFDIVANECKHDNWVYMLHVVDAYPCDDMERYIFWAKLIQKLDCTTDFVGFGPFANHDQIGPYYKSLLVEPNVFKKVNGFSNKYFGWGREDDDLFMRIESYQLKYWKELANFIFWGENIHTNDNNHSPAYNDFLQSGYLAYIADDPSGQILKTIRQNGGYNENLLQSDGLSTLNYEIMEAKQLQKNVRKITVRF